MTSIGFRIMFPAGEPERFRAADAVTGTRRRLLHLEDALVRIDQDFLHENPEAPLIYESGVTYKGEPHTEFWKDYPTLLQDGEGDCEDLVAARVAELRYRFDVPAKPWISYRKEPNGSYLYHFRVWRPTINDNLPPVAIGSGGRAVIIPCPSDEGGFIEDISLALGMP